MESNLVPKGPVICQIVAFDLAPKGADGCDVRLTDPMKHFARNGGPEGDLGGGRGTSREELLAPVAVKIPLPLNPID